MIVKQPIPSSWHCNGLCAGLPEKTYIPVMLDSERSCHLTDSFQFHPMKEFIKYTLPHKFAAVAKFFNCSCLGIKKRLKEIEIVVKLPVSLDFSQLPLFHTDDDSSSQISVNSSSDNITTSSSSESTVSNDENLNNDNNNNNNSQIDNYINNPQTPPVQSTNHLDELRINQTDTLNETSPVTDISNASNSSKAQNNFKKRTSKRLEENRAQSVTSLELTLNLSHDSDDDSLADAVLEKMNELASEPIVVKTENTFDNIEDLIVHTTKDSPRTSRRRSQPPPPLTRSNSKGKGKKSIFPFSESRSTAKKDLFLNEVVVSRNPSKRRGRPCRTDTPLKKLKENKKNTSRNENSKAGSSTTIFSPIPETSTTNRQNEISKDIPPFVERGAIDLVRKKLELLKEKRNKELDPIAESEFIVKEENGKSLFSIDDDMCQDLIVPITSGIENPSEQSNQGSVSYNAATLDGAEIIPDSHNTTISSEGALVVHDIAFDDL